MGVSGIAFGSDIAIDANVDTAIIISTNITITIIMMANTTIIISETTTRTIIFDAIVIKSNFHTDVLQLTGCRTTRCSGRQAGCACMFSRTAKHPLGCRRYCHKWGAVPRPQPLSR
jgi:hypothetical protein